MIQKLEIMNNNTKNICIYTSAIIFGGVVSSLLYYGVSQLSKLSKFYKLSSSPKLSKTNTEEKSDFYHLIHGNIRFVQKLQDLHTPSRKHSPNNPQKILLLSTQSLMHIIDPGLIFDLPPQHIITVSIIDDCVNKNIQEIESIVETHDIKTIVVIGLEKNEKDNQKNQLKELLNTSQYINLAVENKKIKPYWASYNTSTGYVRFHHHKF